MRAVIHAHHSVRFGQDNPVLYQTRRFTLLPPRSAEQQARVNHVTPVDVFQIAAKAGGILWEASQKGTPDEARPSREVAGVRLELGGVQGYTAARVKQEKFFTAKNLLGLGWESTKLFASKIRWLATKEDSPGVRHIWEGLTRRPMTMSS